MSQNMSLSMDSVRQAATRSSCVRCRGVFFWEYNRSLTPTPHFTLQATPVIGAANCPDSRLKQSIRQDKIISSSMPQADRKTRLFLLTTNRSSSAHKMVEHKSAS